MKNLLLNFKYRIIRYRKRKFIYAELSKRYNMQTLTLPFNNDMKIVDTRRKQRLILITDALLKASNIVKKEVVEIKNKKIEHKNMILFKDIKQVIEKHYKDREKELVKENEQLVRTIKNKETEIRNIKQNIAQSIR